MRLKIIVLSHFPLTSIPVLLHSSVLFPGEAYFIDASWWMHCESQFVMIQEYWRLCCCRLRIFLPYGGDLANIHPELGIFNVQSLHKCTLARFNTFWEELCSSDLLSLTLHVQMCNIHNSSILAPRRRRFGKAKDEYFMFT